MESTQETALQAQQRVTRESVLDAIETAANAKANERKAWDAYWDAVKANPEIWALNQSWLAAQCASSTASLEADRMQSQLAKSIEVTK